MIEAIRLPHPVLVEEISGGGSHHQSYNAFGYHCPIENGASVALACYATCHQRTLRGMEATDGTAGNADEHDGEDGQCNRIGMRVLQSVPYLRQCRMVDVKHYQNTDRHEQQGNGEQRVYLTDNLIYRQQSGKDIISENNNNPEGGIQAVGGSAWQAVRPVLPQRQLPPISSG